jgi:ABC-2 type transport system permease protein
MKLSALRQVLVVARFEFISTVTRRSALIVMFGLPLVAVGLGLLLNRMATPAGGSADPFVQAGVLLNEIAIGNVAEESPAGLVDYTGTITSLEVEILRLYASEEEVRTAYDAGEINSYYVIPAGYLDGEEVMHYAENPAGPRQDAERNIIYQALVASWLEEPALVERAMNPANISSTNVSPETSRGGDEIEGEFTDNFLAGIAVFMLFFLTTMGASGYLLQSLGKEKQNRVMEVLLSSVRPSELLAGKVVGLGAFGLLQLVVWGVVVILFFGRSGDTLFQFLPIPDLSLADWFGIALFFIAGYFVYASLYAGLGALAPNPKEGGQYAFLIILPVLIPVWFNSVFFTAPNSLFPTILSLVPFSAPVAMPMRITATVVPWWQIGLSLSLTILTAIMIIALISRFFRSTTLLSGSSLTLRYIWQTVKGG